MYLVNKCKDPAKNPKKQDKLVISNANDEKRFYKDEKGRSLVEWV